ncbi:MAG: hypothetical protein PHT60_16465, partial [Acidiphilium sp.]|nr:hypothetical protein [Acidiphilium sp.]
MPAHDINGTPFLLYTATSGAVKAEPGMPKNMAAFLAGVSSKGVLSKPATASARAAGRPVVPTAHAVPGAADKVTKG